MTEKEWLKNIYLEYQNLVYRVSVSITKDAQLAEDVMQDVFVTLYYHHEKIRDKNSIKAWLTRTTVNRAIDFARKLKKSSPLPVDFIEQQANTSDADPTRRIDERETVAEVQQALEILPPELKALVVLYYYMEMPQKEIAEVLQMPLGTVKTRMKKARGMLRKHLESTTLSPNKGEYQYD